MESVLDPAWPATRPLLWLALAALLAVLVLRAIRRDRRGFRRFTRYRTTKRRQATLRRWLTESLLTFGGLSAAALLLAGGFAGPMLASAQSWPWLRWLRDGIGASPVLTGAVIAVLALGIVGLTAMGVAAARQEGDVPSVGNIRALLPRNRQELGLGALLSLNAGVMEELAFRLALPALLFGASGSAIVAVAGSIVVFGALHLYQGAAGIIGSTVLGAGFMLAYLLTGSIVVPIVLHVLLDLRSLVIIPMAVFGVHRIDGRAVPITAPPGRATRLPPPASGTAPPAAPRSTR